MIRTTTTGLVDDLFLFCAWKAPSQREDGCMMTIITLRTRHHYLEWIDGWELIE